MTGSWSGSPFRSLTPFMNCSDGIRRSQKGKIMARSEPKIAQSSEAGEPRESDLRPAVRSVSFAEAFRFWVKLGFISFGGPAGQIAIMHRELVERRRWLSEERSAILTQLDLQPAAPPATVSEMRPLERVAEIVSEQFIGQVQEIQLYGAGHFVLPEQIDACRKIQDCAGPNPPTLKVHQRCSWRGFQLFQIVRSNFN